MDGSNGSGAQKLPRNPRESANFLSYLFFWYTSPVFRKSTKKEIGMEDLYSVLDAHKSQVLGDRMCKGWTQELERAKKAGREPSLLKSTARVFSGLLTKYGFLMFFIEFFLRLTQPILLGGIISYYADPDNQNITTAYWYSGGLVVICALNVLCSHGTLLGLMHMGMKVRLGLCSMIYRKSLRMSQTALGVTTVGQVVNLLSNDVGRMDMALYFVHYLWIAPLQAVVALIFMYVQIGVAAVWGVIFLLLWIPVQGYLGKLTSSWRFKTAIRTDERVRLMNEIIQGVQVIKMYAWEKPFGKVVQWARKRELRMIRNVSYIRGVFLALMIFITRTSIFISLVTYALTGNLLTAQKAFVVTAFYNIVRQSMTIFFPQGLHNFVETLVSFRRIKNFLMYEEAKDAPLELSADKLIPGELKKTIQSIYAIRCQKVTAKWDPNSLENTLENIDLNVERGNLIAVIGKVGSGKSSLLQGILRELPLQSGSIQVDGDVSYAAQEPWLFSASVQQNILFGKPMDQQRYLEVVRRCALDRDFSLFEFGDQTIVGERGASLSGGQRARISLARACYRDATIYLLDDPLSAVDAHVGRHLFDQCIQLLLGGKTVVLVTHQLQFLQSADKIIIMDKGRIIDSGTYDSLRKSGLDFAKMLTRTAETEESEEEEDFDQENKCSVKRSSQTSKKSQNVQTSQAKPKAVEETRKEGSISLAVYKKYLGGMGGIAGLTWIVTLCIATQALASYADFFLTLWTKNEEIRGIEDVPLDDPSRFVDIYIFTGITVATIIIAFSRSLMFFALAVKAAKSLHHAMYTGVTRATMFFFNTNPSGRILNRFSKDMGQVDENLPQVLIDVVQIALTILGIVVIVSLVNPFLLIPTGILFAIFYLVRKFYLKSSRNIKRMDATTRSPVYSHLGASLSGLSTIRAFKAQAILTREFDATQDLNSSAYYMFMTTSRAFGFSLDFVSVIYIAVVILSFFLMDGVAGGNVGLAITQVLTLTGMVQYGMRQSAELENTMTAVERVVEYETVDAEKDIISKPQKPIGKDWLRDGKIEFKGVNMRYEPRMDSKRVLRDLNLTIKPREKVGIVGRTGAGKSSLISAIFRLSYLEGHVLIDGHDIQQISLENLRRNISIIPQEPVLFSGTMRYNLDPFNEFSDDKLWSVLRDVHFEDAVKELPEGLEGTISEGGSNFSVGQRQLVCLARAILRENKILVMDEATANVDPITDNLIQKTIREKFQDCTVLTIAHRLLTVVDADKVLVMDAGQALEFDSPYNLLRADDGPRIFQSMVKESGRGIYEEIMSKAEAAEKIRPKLE